MGSLRAAYLCISPGVVVQPFRLPRSRKYLKMIVRYVGPNGVFLMRSSWELAFAQWLDAHRIPWSYEPRVFKMGRMSYVPDFHLTRSNVWIEIKGRLTKRASAKMLRFQKAYPQERLYILRQKELKELGVLGKGVANG